MTGLRFNKAEQEKSKTKIRWKDIKKQKVLIFLDLKSLKIVDYNNYDPRFKFGINFNT